MLKPPHLHHIQRIDDESKRTHAWYVRVQRKNHVMDRHFSDGILGGKRQALRAAIAWRDKILAALDDQHYDIWRRNKKRRNNTSGIVGVGRYATREVSGDGIAERYYWQAFWEGRDGKRHSRKFSIAKYGEAGAKSRARAARRTALEATLDIALNS